VLCSTDGGNFFVFYFLFMSFGLKGSSDILGMLPEGRFLFEAPEVRG
jgi:hypothetical protein